MKRLYEFLINSKSTGIFFEPEFVDLGLKSHTLWCSCNLGAKEETDYGDYYQWGALKKFDDYDASPWEICPFNNGSKVFNVENFNKNKKEMLDNDFLSKKYDVAVKKLKDAFIPQPSHFDELRLNTTYEWVANYNNTGINGVKFTGKHGNYIFIPMTGLYAISNNNKLKLKLKNQSTYLWTNRIDNNTKGVSHAFNVDYDFKTITFIYICYALPIRPIKNNNVKW